MKKFLTFFSFLITIAVSAQLKYPDTKKIAFSEEYFGTTKVPDPYRWLEDDNSAETKAWVQEENKVTFTYLNTIPDRDKIRTRLEQLWNYPKYSSPFRKAGYYYFFKNDGLQNQSVLYRQKGMKGNIACITTHHFYDEDPVMRFHCIPDLVDGTHGCIHGGIKTDSKVGA